MASILANYGTRNHDIYLITLDSKVPFYELKEKVTLDQAPVQITSSNKKKRFFTNGLWLRKTVKRINPDVVCSFGEKYNPYALLFLTGLNIPVYVANRASPLTYLRGIKGFITPFAYKLAAGVVLQTQKSKDLLQPRYIMKNTVVIGNPIDLDYPENEQKPIVLNVGSIGGDKNQDWLIEYFKDVRPSTPEGWQLHFVGDGPNRSNCEQLVKDKGIAESVVFQGIQKDPKPFYSQSAIFAFTSTSEGFPNALAEAMAAGCACIAYDCIAGPSDIIDNGVNGFLIPEGDEEQYKEKLKLLMNNPELRERFGKAAREKMKKFEASEVAERFFRFITECVKV